MKLDSKKVIYVGFAFLLIQAFWIAYDAIVPLMLVNKFGMNQTWSGIIMALDNILAIFMLPLFGSLSDKSKSKMGKRKPYVLIGTLCAVVAFMGLSAVDFVQYKNLGAQAETPLAQQSTEESVRAHSLFWDSNYVIDNNEYSKTNKVNNNVLGKELATRDYVAQMIYGCNFDDLNENQKAACKEWYVNIDLSTSYIYSNENGVAEYSLYSVRGNDAYLIVFDDNGELSFEKISADVTKQINAVNVYSSLIGRARSVYAAEITYKNPFTLIMFIVMLLLTLVSMSVFRSPAVALMPDVVVKPLRSKGNAVINLMGVVGGIFILGAGMLFGTDKPQNQVMPYMGYMACVCGIMLIALLIFMLKVKEPEWNAQMLEEQAEIDAKEEILMKSRTITADESITDGGAETPCGDGAENQKAPENADKRKGRLKRPEFISLIFILLSVAFWYMGYNAITSKYSLYAINELGKAYNMVLLVAQVVAVIAFLPIGVLSGKLGRKKMIIIGVAMLAASFASACFVRRSTHDWVLYVLFAVAGIAWAAINVNSFPMVVELAKGGDIGKYTGYYYTASMAAQIVTPFLSGLIMDVMGSMRPLFYYGTFFVVLSFITMLFVKHGDSKPVPKKDALEYLDVGDD